MIGGNAIGQCVRSAGIIRHVAADGTGGLAARIGSVEIAVFGDGFGDIEIDDAGFDDGESIFQIDSREFDPIATATK